ncbi:MAG: hypothetical protein C0622_03190 [Desulfuromonas sp.]|nr:MAG: hypothetical protein C0622_03190 [Desulfuromonas sp.]
MLQRFALLCLVVSLTACSAAHNIAKVPPQGSKLPFTTIATLDNGTEVHNGGFGSAMTAHPSKAGHFYALTDRGPNTNYTGSAGKGKKFPVPDYTPRIGEFKVTGDGSVALVRTILLKDPSGTPISGRPNPKGLGATGEIPYDNAGQVLEFDPYGLDSEGLVAMKDGSFWISDEYAPHIVHYSKDGIELERMSPLGVKTAGRKLPAVLERRWANRGMEGLTITPDEKTLVGIMQSTLYNPSKKEATNLTLTRILTFDLQSGATHQYLYRQEKAKNANSEIASLSADTFLVVERDGAFSGEKAAQKTLYKINLRGATDISGDVTAISGGTLNGKTLEQCSWEEIAAAGVKPVTKELVADLVELLPNHYPHDKLEGLWIIDAQTVGVLNDDDFAVWPKGDEVVQKILPGVDETDANTLYIIKLDKPLF